MSSAYSKVGASLVARGFAALPVQPGTKAPGDYMAGRWSKMTGWSTRCIDGPPSTFDVMRWGKAPSAGVCVVLGKSSRNLVAIDIDAEDVAEAVKKSLPPTPVRKRGQKGETLFFWGNTNKRAFNRDSGERLVDVLGEGSQTVLPPTVHKDTNLPYAWIGEIALEDSDDSDIPQLPENVIEILEAVLRPFGYMPKNEFDSKSIIIKEEQDGTAFQEINLMARQNLDAWVPDLCLYRCERQRNGKYQAVADWRPSCTGRPLEKRKQNLSIHPEGINDFGDGPKWYSAIDLVIAAGKANDASGAYIWLSDRLMPNAPIIEFIPKQRPVEEPEVEILEEAEIIPFTKKTDVSSMPPWREDIDIRKCPGLVGKIAEYLQARSQKPQPLISIGAAMAFVGALSGRQLCGPTDLNTHVFICGIAPSGAGKDAPMSGIGKIIERMGLDQTLRAGDRFKSDAAIYTTLIESPTCVALIDEFGNFLSKLNSTRASSHEIGISGVLRSVYGINFGSLKTPDGATQRGVPIYAPCLSLIGTSTAEEFYEALSSRDVVNGFLNRFIILNGEDSPQRIKPKLRPNDIPKEIIEGALNIWNRLDEVKSAAYRGSGTTPLNSPAVMVPWATKDAELAFDNLVDEIDSWRDKNRELTGFCARTAENALRAATIRAIGIDYYEPKVTVEDLAWGEALAKQSAAMLMAGYKANVAVNDRQAWGNKILAMIRRKNGAVKVRDIQQYIRSALSARQIREHLDDLASGGFIELVDVTNSATDSKKVLAYRSIGDE